ncbi:MAG TPA: ATP synthase F1 subunit delta [Bacteroidia bacterium]|nr:ATP synthase F1 subunit delta [Bacteroidia bacterium]
MSQTAVAIRYAKSLIQIANEKGILDAVYDDMRMVLAGCKKLKDLSALLNSPVVKTEKKVQVLKMIFGGNVNHTTEDFIILLAKKRREGYLEIIATEFIAQYKDQKHIITATVTTAIPLDETTRKNVMEILKKFYKTEIELHEKVDMKLIGGFIITVGSKQVDMSIQHQLNALRKDFNQSYILN